MVSSLLVEPFNWVLIELIISMGDFLGAWETCNPKFITKAAQIGLNFNCNWHWNQFELIFHFYYVTSLSHAFEERTCNTVRRLVQVSKEIILLIYWCF